MQTFDLDIKHKGRIQGYPFFFSQSTRKAGAFFLFDPLEPGDGGRIDLFFQSLDLAQIRDPALPDQVGDHFGKTPGLQSPQPPALGNAVCLILKRSGYHAYHSLSVSSLRISV